MSTWFQRRLLPGLAYKAVVIGGGYATGRELAEFFLPSGPWGGIAAMALAMLIWSAICVTTFLFSRASGALDYRTFIRCRSPPVMRRNWRTSCSSWWRSRYSARLPAQSALRCSAPPPSSARWCS